MKSMPPPSRSYGTATQALVFGSSMRIDPWGIICGPGEPHEQWLNDTTIPTCAMTLAVVLTTAMLNRIGGPPGRTVVLSCAAMVKSMPSADPLVPGLIGTG